MSMTSKSPLKVAAAAYQAGKKALPRYAHKYSRQDFSSYEAGFVKCFSFHSPTVVLLE